MDQALLDEGYRCYTGEKIDVYFNTAICQHSGNCVRGNGKLFNLKRKPWIMPDDDKLFHNSIQNFYIHFRLFQTIHHQAVRFH